MIAMGEDSGLLDRFQKSFKYYKANQPPPGLQDVIQIEDGSDKRLEPVTLPTNGLRFPGLLSPECWRTYRVSTRPGLLVVANPFTGDGQRYWATRCVVDYPGSNNTNLLPQQLEEPLGPNGWWQLLQSCTDPTKHRKLAKALRWATLGFHYDWTNKTYDDRNRSPFPGDLGDLVCYLAAVFGHKQFSPEAAIVNFYPVGSTLAGHTDHSEDDLTAPLFSISFGRPAIFLIGGPTRNDTPDAMLLQSGDIIVMSGPSRQYYHSVPRVFSVLEAPLEKQHSRLSIEQQSKVVGLANICTRRWKECQSVSFWNPIQEYLENTRININVRQVKSSSMS
ncbi:nucleic acid dioxygenase ALKBH1-like [Anopheles albimanus]|uniref:nucleic acid dioxygenase ALKBH1-like n=1 Tax=Anopheles albimanus TaxID=7167 RepID=UPI00163F295A|nr:nucleic acid dioxygenase ALKBH1-like [Anopheles albimanus]